MADNIYDVRLKQYDDIVEGSRYYSGLTAQTQFTWHQRTIGAGFKLVTVDFDVWFTHEPVFMYGSALLAVSGPDYLPINNGCLVYWKRDVNSGCYVGAAVALTVDLRYVPGFHVKERTTGSGSSAAAIPQVGHHLTFSGPAMPNISSDGTGTANPKSTGIS